MVIKIKYKNNRFDLVKSEILDQFLTEGKVKEFYRYSENRWVTVGHDPMRCERGPFGGAERRSPELRRMSQGQ
jgi:hypothetical protein